MSTYPNPYSDAELADRVTVRMNRQARLAAGDPLSVWFVLNEGVIQRRVGGYDVWQEQIGHLIDLAKHRPNVHIQVLPFDAGEHGAMHGAFHILSFPNAEDPDRVYLEQQIGGYYTQTSEQVAQYARIFDHLRAKALSPELTIELLESAQ